MTSWLLRNSPFGETIRARLRTNLAVKAEVDTRVFVESFYVHWKQAWAKIQAHQNGTAVAMDDVSSVLNHVDEVVELLCRELERPAGGADQRIADLFVAEAVPERLLVWSRHCGQFEPLLRTQLLRVYERLLRQPGVGALLAQQRVLRPLTDLLLACHRSGEPELRRRLVCVLEQLCEALQRQPAMLGLFLALRPDGAASSFVIFSLLVELVHGDGVVGVTARKALLLCMELSGENDQLAQYIVDHSSFCPVLATGLSGLYSALPRALLPSSADSQPLPEVDAFVTSLEFCNAVMQTCHPLIAVQLQEFVYQGFLVSVVAPALHQSSADEVVTATTYLELCVRSVDHPRLVLALARLLLLHRHGAVPLLETLVQRIAATPKLAVATLSLLHSLLDLNCEDVMLELVFRPLLPCAHLMSSQRSRVREPDLHGSGALRLLSLVPACCQAWSVPGAGWRLCLREARAAIAARRQATAGWTYAYDGVRPAPAEVARMTRRWRAASARPQEADTVSGAVQGEASGPTTGTAADPARGPALDVAGDAASGAASEPSSDAVSDPARDPLHGLASCPASDMSLPCDPDSGPNSVSGPASEPTGGEGASGVRAGSTAQHSAADGSARLEEAAATGVRCRQPQPLPLVEGAEADERRGAVEPVVPPPVRETPRRESPALAGADSTADEAWLEGDASHTPRGGLGAATNTSVVEDWATPAGGRQDLSAGSWSGRTPDTTPGEWGTPPDSPSLDESSAELASSALGRGILSLLPDESPRPADGAWSRTGEACPPDREPPTADSGASSDGGESSNVAGLSAGMSASCAGQAAPADAVPPAAGSSSAGLEPTLARGKLSPDAEELSPNFEEPPQAGNEPSSAGNVPSPATDEPFPATDEPSPGTDELSTARDELSPATDELSPATDKLSPTTDDPSPVADEPSPGTDALSPITNEQSPGMDEPSSGTDKLSPAGEKLSTATDEPSPGTDEPTPVTDEPTSAKDEPSPTKDETFSAPGEPSQTSYGQSSPSDGASPPTDGASPTIDGTSPATDGASRTTDGASPATDGTSLATDRTSPPATDGTSPATDGASLATDRASPATDQLATEPRESSQASGESSLAAAAEPWALVHPRRPLAWERGDDVLGPSPSVGPFLSALLERLELATTNSLQLNLMLMSVITRLGQYPQPLLRSLLFNHTIVLQPSVRSLVQTLGSLKHRIDLAMRSVQDSPGLVRWARRRLLARQAPPADPVFAPAPATAAAQPVSAAAVGPVEAEARGFNLNSMVKKLRRSVAATFEEPARQRPEPADVRWAAGEPAEPWDAAERRVAVTAILLEHWLAELAALALEHAVAAEPPLLFREVFQHEAATSDQSAAAAEGASAP